MSDEGRGKRIRVTLKFAAQPLAKGFLLADAAAGRDAPAPVLVLVVHHQQAGILNDQGPGRDADRAGDAVLVDVYGRLGHVSAAGLFFTAARDLK